MPSAEQATALDTLFAAPAFPFTVGVAGTLANKPTAAVVATSIVNILRTIPGTIPYNPEFGSTVATLPFDRTDPTFYAAVKYYAQKDIERWEPRAIVRGVEARPDEAELDKVRVAVSFSIREDSAGIFGVTFSM